MKNVTMNFYKVAFFNGKNDCIYHCIVWSDSKENAIKQGKLNYTIDTSKLYNGDNIKAQMINY